jgi:predicted nuclease of predicted toxin-antitoxin system
MNPEIKAAQAFAADYLSGEEIIYRWSVPWLADECIAAPLVAFLRSQGHDVPPVCSTRTSSILHCEGRLLLTEDKDFGDLVVRRGHEVPGTVLLRLGSEADQFQAV